MADRTCQDCRALISAFIDGEATREENARLRQHLAACADCRSTLDAYRGIGGSLRAMPAVHPPQHLTESIFAQTIDAEPRRLFLITSRLGYSMAAVAAVLLIFAVATYLIIGGYSRGIDPEVASSQPTERQTWPLHLPIKIKFNKEMNRESVEAALGIVPSREQQRLSVIWDGNTLIIGEGTPLKPGTSYEIKISTDATDRWGKPLSVPFELAFTTSESQTTIQTPTPGVEPTQTVEPSTASPTTEATESSRVSTPSKTSDATVTATHAPTHDEPRVPGNGTTVVPDNPTGPSAPTATSTLPEPTSTPVATQPSGSINATASPTSPAATATTVPPSATPSPTVTATATASATATATVPTEPTITPTPDSIPVVGAIGDIYWRDQAVQDRLGQPVSEAQSIVTNQLDFQSGVMMLAPSGESIYVFKFGSGWDIFGVLGGDTPESVEMPEGGIYSPGGDFGALWESDQSIQDSVGYALQRYEISYSATIQLFEWGSMIETPTTVYVVYDDGTWDWFAYSSS